MSAPTFIDIASKVVIPLATFGLGIAVSYLLKVRDKRRDDEQEHIRQITRLCSEWHELLVELYAKATGDRVERAQLKSGVMKYVRRATILPGLHLHRAALRRTGKYEQLLTEVDALFNSLTTHTDIYRDVMPDARPEIAKQRLEAMLNDFDRHIQEIYRQAGMSLAR